MLSIITAIMMGVALITDAYSHCMEVYHYKYIREKQQEQYRLMQEVLKIMAQQIEATQGQQEYTARILNSVKLKNYVINQHLKELEQITEEVKGVEGSFNIHNNGKQHTRRKNKAF